MWSIWLLLVVVLAAHELVQAVARVVYEQDSQG